ncbi:MAG: acyltransferase family protein, partial [Acidimicrobiia bacterium]
MSFLASIRRQADATPIERNRVVDLLRAASILVVVFGHWLMAAVTIEEGELIPGHLLILADWTHPLTWLFQVMPLFFLVGGYANGLSWRSARHRSESYGGWLRSRLRRLVLPVVPLLLFWTAGGWLGLRLGLDWEVLQLASQVALVPTWFLAAYVVIVTLAPIGLWLWERWGWWSIVVGIALAGLCDWLSISAGVVPAGFLNYILVWGTVHQVGYAWLDGT